jgi:hypothetical protein
MKVKDYEDHEEKKRSEYKKCIRFLVKILRLFNCSKNRNDKNLNNKRNNKF